MQRPRPRPWPCGPFRAQCLLGLMPLTCWVMSFLALWRIPGAYHCEDVDVRNGCCAAHTTQTECNSVARNTLLERWCRAPAGVAITGFGLYNIYIYTYIYSQNPVTATRVGALHHFPQSVFRSILLHCAYRGAYQREQNLQFAWEGCTAHIVAHIVFQIPGHAYDISTYPDTYQYVFAFSLFC